MTRSPSGLRTLCAGVLMAASFSLQPLALAADFIPDYTEVGPCGDDRVLQRITDRFRHQVKHVPNLPNVDIVEFMRIYQNRYLPKQQRWPIGRRYCGATVYMSDGQSRPIWYLIEESMGFATMGDKVEFCVLGFDRWYVYDGACRVLREPPPSPPATL